MSDRLTEETIRNRFLARLELRESQLKPIERESLVKRIRCQIVLNVLPKLHLTSYRSLRRTYSALETADQDNDRLHQQVNTLLDEQAILNDKIQKLKSQPLYSGAVPLRPGDAAQIPIGRAATLSSNTVPPREDAALAPRTIV